MRKACLQCVWKHLGQAMVVFMESKLGYPEHRLLVVGHLAEASEEAIQTYPELAETLREHRVKWMEDLDYEIPFFELYQQVEAMLNKENSEPPDSEIDASVE